ncbi:MAG: SRPBCC domain-containing protein [Acidobacteria bacterium]|nr:SRPBCC domain-containing protein [Acidobacteriota bacterium]
MTKPPLEKSVFIQVPCQRAFDAFFDGADLRHWWRTDREILALREDGLYALHWSSQDKEYALFGRIRELQAARQFQLASLFYFPPGEQNVGPMDVWIRFEPEDEGTRIQVLQTGFGEGPFWDRYYEDAQSGWENALQSLKNYLEER